MLEKKKNVMTNSVLCRYCDLLGFLRNRLFKLLNNVFCAVNYKTLQLHGMQLKCVLFFNLKPKQFPHLHLFNAIHPDGKQLTTVPLRYLILY